MYYIYRETLYETVYYDSLQLTSSTQKAKEKGHRTHGLSSIMHAYGLKSRPVAQGLVKDTNAKHAYGSSSTLIAQGLVYRHECRSCLWAERIKAYLWASTNTYSSRAGGDHKHKRHKTSNASKSPRAGEHTL